MIRGDTVMYGVCVVVGADCVYMCVEFGGCVVGGIGRGVEMRRGEYEC